MQHLNPFPSADQLYTYNAPIYCTYFVKKCSQARNQPCPPPPPTHTHTPHPHTPSIPHVHTHIYICIYIYIYVCVCLCVCVCVCASSRQKHRNMLTKQCFFLDYTYRYVTCLQWYIYIFILLISCINIPEENGMHLCLDKRQTLI